MNPLLSQFMSAVLRWVLTGVGAWFVQKGILDGQQVEEMIGGAILAILALAWSFWSKYKSKIELFTIAAMPKGTTLEEAQAKIATGVKASAGTGAGDVPVLVNTNTADRVSPRLWFLPLLLAGTVIAAPACSVGKPPVTVPVITEAEQARVRELATKALSGIEIAGIVVRDARQLVSDLTTAGVVPVPVRTSVNDAVIRANGIVQVVITELAGATREITVRSLAARAVAALQDVAGLLEAQADARVQTAGKFLRSAVSALGALVGVTL